MTPGARILAAIEIGQEIETGESTADGIVETYFRRRRYAGSKDRRAVGERVYGIIRRYARLSWWIERCGYPHAVTPRVRAIADLALNDKARPEEIQAIFSGSRHCPESLNAEEFDLANALAGRPITHHSEMPDWVALEYPGWLDATLREQFGDTLNSEMTALNQPAPMDLRVNTTKTTFEEASEALRREQVISEPTALSPIALRVSGNVRLGGTSAYNDGLVEIQDEGSQILALLCDAQPSMNVVDFCAGAGGKTLALAACMSKHGNLHGSLTACDVFAQRLQRMKLRIKRAGANGVRQHVLSTELDPWVAQNAQTADRVLLDVPCSGSGIWRRKPGSKWRLTPMEVEDYITTQRQILSSASAMVRPGGRLIYATCSLLAEENEQQVAWFMSDSGDFDVLDVNTVWAQSIGGTCPSAGPYLRLSPATTRTDGFFCAILERRP